MAVERILVFAVALAAAAGAGAPVPEASAPEASAPGPCSWVPLGPFAVPRGEGYDGTRVPVSGRVSALALDPGDPSVVYLGSALGGVWRSPDAGASWLPVSDGEASLAIGALAVDPVQAGIVYAGTGEANLAFRLQFVQDDRPLSGHRGRGVLKSADGGRSWRLLGEQALRGLAFAEMSVSPHQPSLLLAATTGGLFRSLDRGESWSRLERDLPAAAPQAMATSVAFHPGDPDVAYAAFWGKGVYRSDDVRSPAPAWKQLFGGLPLSNLSRTGLAVSPAGPDTLYALAATADSDLRGFYVSEDRGESWDQVAGAPDLLQGQGFFNLLLAAHPVQKGVVYLGGSGRRQEHPSSLYRGSRVNGRWRFTPLGPELHIDLHALVFDPRDPDVLFVGTDGGVWRTRDGGRTWEARNAGLATLQFTRIDQHPASGAFLIGGTQDNGTLLFRGGPVWDQGDNGDGGFVAVDPARPEVVYNEFTLHKIARSEQAGAYGSFVPIHPEVRGGRSVFLAPFALDPDSPGVLALGLERVHRSADSGRTWEALTIDLSRGWTSRQKVNAISALLYARRDLMYAGTSDGKVWRLAESEGVWRADDLTARPDAPPGERYVTDLALAPGNQDLLYVAFDGEAGPGLWLHRGGGWRGLTLPEAQVFAVEVEPREPAVIYAGTAQGLYRSRDAGATWSAFDEGLPRTSVFDLQRHRTLPLLRAATHGRGVWERDVSGRPCPAVELYLRDDPLDQGRGTEGPEPPPDSPGMSPDIKVVPLSQAPGKVGFVEFWEAAEAPLRPGEPHRILVQVGNR
ncbi:MAG TPA: hypothetical protein VF414_01830, partial [Thermoanaerobaculia bacterium]